MITEQDIKHLKRCVELAESALEEGNQPFGSILVSEDGNVLFEDYNRISSGDDTQHPEFSIARYAAEHLSKEERARAIVYTSGEHCPMCSAAHGWVGLGKIIYASSSNQLAQWLHELNVSPSPVRNLSIEEVVKGIEVEGPVPELAEEVRKLHVRLHKK
ncbi:nucleoside deaminase [Priestia flexa]|uniref:Nucleoside deaminase n=1 Tax=Priestia flexa TaxID=86664 RepID=A0ABU4JB68_9BACI|nr:nucleoside deaminase [Priestia flexa]MBY6087557.1 nucleoside deaminase [Priestia flexa]MCA1201365.1 nucleoside deaminase [Priestia flexa]MCG7315118.1 nucleoside deaminase [Priestia flexa]MDW8518224.1 nucleoside deaminase [Priestia flexa]